MSKLNVRFKTGSRTELPRATENVDSRKAVPKVGSVSEKPRKVVREVMTPELEKKKSISTVLTDAVSGTNEITPVKVRRKKVDAEDIGTTEVDHSVARTMNIATDPIYTVKVWGRLPIQISGTLVAQTSTYVEVLYKKRSKTQRQVFGIKDIISVSGGLIGDDVSIRVYIYTVLVAYVGKIVSNKDTLILSTAEGRVTLPNLTDVEITSEEI